MRLPLLARWAIRATVAGAALVLAAQVWVQLRPEVRATGGANGVYYSDDTHHVVFGSDAVFMVVTGVLALVTSSAVLAVRRRQVELREIALGTGLAGVGSVAVAWCGALLDGIARGPLQTFPPRTLEQGETVIEPARLHMPAALGVGAMCWLSVVFISAVAGRRDRAQGRPGR